VEREGVGRQGREAGDWRKENVKQLEEG